MVGRKPSYSSVSQDRKSTRLNSSHVKSSYAVFCLKKKNNYLGCKTKRCKSNRDQTQCAFFDLRERRLYLVLRRIGHLSGLRGFFFFNDTATTEIYTLSLHDALPI